MTNTQFFLLVFDYWAKKKGFSDITKTEDKRITSPAMIVTEIYRNKTTFSLLYNSEHLKQIPFYMVMQFSLHEVGHLVDKHQEYETVDEQIRSELYAEQWSLKILKRYYRVLYYKVCKKSKRFLKYLSAVRNLKSYKVYYKAYSKIKEYK